MSEAPPPSSGPSTAKSDPGSLLPLPSAFSNAKQLIPTVKSKKSKQPPSGSQSDSSTATYGSQAPPIAIPSAQGPAPGTQLLKKMIAGPIQFVQGVYHKSVHVAHGNVSPISPQPSSFSALPSSDNPLSSPGRRRAYDFRRMLNKTAALSGAPPQGYIWLYLGKFRRWQRKFFVASNPGVVQIYKKSNLQGKAVTITLKDMSVVEDETNSRQFKLVSTVSDGTIFLRTLHPEERTEWVEYLRISIETYQKNREVVDGLKDIVPTEEPTGERKAAEFAKEHLFALPELGGLELAPDQRRKLRQRFYEHMAELRPFEQEFERHVNQLHLQLSAIAAGLQLHSPATPPLLAARSEKSLQQWTLEQDSLKASGEAAGLQLPPPTPAPSQYDTPTGSLPPSRLDTEGPPTPTQDLSAPQANAVAALAAGAGDRASGPGELADRPFASMLSRAKRSDKPSPDKAATMPQAYGNFLEQVRRVLQKETLRCVQLEEENAAMQKALSLVRGRGPGTSGVSKRAQSGHNLAASNAPTQAAGNISSADSDSEDFVSVMEGSEDPMSKDQDLRGFEGPDDDDEDEQHGLLNALEVVHQVEYVAKNDKGLSLTAGEEPPSDAELDDDREDTVTMDEADGHTYRLRLPAPKPLGRGFSIWSVLKNCIGRDLTKITMPATINEPLSVLQRLAEDMEYTSLLEKTVDCSESVDRLLWVALYILTAYNSQPTRDNKPFNPLLGETFEWQSPDNKYRFISEQVSHHPPISCYHAEGGLGNNGGSSFQMYAEFETKTKFWGRSLELMMAGHQWMTLQPWGDEYRWNKGNVSINNIIMGNYWIECIGEIKVVNVKTGDSARLVMQPCRGQLDQRGGCEGWVSNAAGEVVWTISGNYTSSLSAARAGEESSVVWTRYELPDDVEEQYMFTKFAIALNDNSDPLVPLLPPTDSRFRPDQRALEQGEHQRATSEKLRLEDKQRKARHARKLAGEEYHTLWFEQTNPDDKELVRYPDERTSAWQFNGSYWNRKWDKCPDIY